MMGNNDFINEPEDREIEIIMKYVPAYTVDNAQNIKNKFFQKTMKKQKTFSIRRLALVCAVTSMFLITTLVYAEVIDISRIYRIVFGENSKYLEQYIEPFTEPLVTARDNGTTPALEIHNDDVIDIPVEKDNPVSIKSEYDGIVIKLISAINDENFLRIFATVTDTVSDRLGESLGLDWGLSQGHGGDCNVFDYNNETKTATILITSLGSDHEGDATLTVDSISTRREFQNDLQESKIDISTLLVGHIPNEISQDDHIWKRGGGHRDWEAGYKLSEESRLLQPDEMDIAFSNIDMLTISNMGFVDGVFHLQTKTRLNDPDVDREYNIILSLFDAETQNTDDGAARIDFITDRKYAYQEYSNDPHDLYKEYIFDNITSPEQLSSLSIIWYIINPPTIRIEGHWEFSFKIPDKVTTEFHVDREFNINGEKVKIDTVSLSPLGVTFYLPVNMSTTYTRNDTVYVENKDGIIIELDQSYIQTYEGQSSLNFSGQIIEIENVQGIIINGERISITP